MGSPPPPPQLTSPARSGRPGATRPPSTLSRISITAATLLSGGFPRGDRVDRPGRPVADEDGGARAQDGHRFLEAGEDRGYRAAGFGVLQVQLHRLTLAEGHIRNQCG